MSDLQDKELDRFVKDLIGSSDWFVKFEKDYPGGVKRIIQEVGGATAFKMMLAGYFNLTQETRKLQLKQFQQTADILGGPPAKNATDATEMLDALSTSANEIDIRIREMFEAYPDAVREFFKDKHSMPLIHKVALKDQLETEKNIRCSRTRKGHSSLQEGSHRYS